MSNEMTLFGGAALPSYLQGAELDATTKALAGSGGGGRRISIKGGIFRMVVDGKQVAENEDRAMNVVVVAAAPHINRQWHEKAYVEGGEATAADCMSEDGKTPSKDSAKPQSTSCDTCPQNIAGSGQGDSRACRYQQRLAVVLEGEMDGPVYQLPLPAASLFGKGEANGKKLPLQAYARLLAQNGVPITAVVTEMRFDTAVSTPKLTFSPVRPLAQAEFETIKEQGASSDAQQAIKLTVFKQDGGKPAAKVETKPAAPVTEDGSPAEAEPAEPKVASKAKPAAPAGKRPVSEVIAAWDE